MRIWRRLGPLLAVLLVLNLVPMVATPDFAVAQERPPLTYFALGDSYASGHGLQDDPGDSRAGAYGAGDDRNCRRSPSSYPYLVADALRDTYTVDLHHFACSGATAAPTKLSTSDDRYHPDKSLSHQVETANAILDERDRTGLSGPVLVTITIGANDLGIDGAGAEAIKQVIKPINSNFTGPEFFQWLDGKTATINANLTPVIDSLLDHEHVRIVLTDYPNPFREGGFALFCPDFFGSLTCDGRMDHLMLSLTATMAGQVGRVDDRSHLHFTTLGSRFASHYSNCAPFTPSDNAPETWFQDEIQVSDYTRIINNAEYNIILNDVIANMDQCFHPNEKGAQAIADAVVERALTMLPASATAQSRNVNTDQTVNQLVQILIQILKELLGTSPQETGTGAIAVVSSSHTGTTPGGTTSTNTNSAGVAVELILDTSGSMDEQDQGGQTRLEVAKEVTTRLVTEALPEGVPMALRTYGGCSSSLSIPMQPLDPDAAVATIADLRAGGDTPIAQSLRAAGDDLEGVAGPKIIVLVTDGEETCGGDPLTEIEALVAQNINVQVNIVGFAIDDAEVAATFEEWARVGNGNYYKASDEIELQQAVTTASQLAFRVIDQQGTMVAEGVVGGDAVSVSAGIYTVEVDTEPVTIREDVVVTAQQITTIELNAGGSASDTVSDDRGGKAQPAAPSGVAEANDQPVTPNGDQEANNLPATPDIAEKATPQPATPAATEEENAQIIVPIGGQEANDQTATPDGDPETNDLPATPASDQDATDQVTTPDGDDVANDLPATPDAAEDENAQIIVPVGDQETNNQPTSPTSDQETNGQFINMGIAASGPNGHEIGAAFTVTTLNGEYIGSCTLEGDPAEPYVLACYVPVPYGITVVVREDVSTITPGTAPVENPLYFDTGTIDGSASFEGVGFQNVPQAGTGSTNQTSDVAIVTTENGQSATDVCYVLVDFSNEGCDENADGKVTFDDVPIGTYTVRQTADLGPNRYVSDFAIQVTGTVSSDGWERFPATIVGGSTTSDSSGSSGSIDIALITRAPDTGGLLTDACYVLVGYSNEGCDENGDGQVTFDDIPSGTYTVHQTQSPAGYEAINDYDINVWPLGDLPDGRVLEVPLGFVVRQAPEQNAHGTLNVSVILIDAATGEKVSTGVCVELVGGSTVKCDDDLPDGQIDFVDVPEGGPYELRFSNVPAGWQVGTDGQPYTVSVNPQADTPANQFAFILLVKSDSESTNAGGGAMASNQGQGDQIIVPQVGAQAPVESTGSTESSSSSSTQSTAQEIANGGLWELGIAAHTEEAGSIDHTIGARFIVTSEEGEFIGECTLTEPSDTWAPWWNCEVAVPSDRISLVWEDLESIPAGYAPVENPLVFDPTTYVPGPHQIGAAFENVPVNGDISSSSGSAEATLLMTFRGCPGGFDPNTDDFHAACTIPLDAPTNAFLDYHGEGQGGEFIAWLDRQPNGEYVYVANPATMNLDLMYLATDVRDDYQVFGADSANGDVYDIDLADGETREVFIFYYD